MNDLLSVVQCFQTTRNTGVGLPRSGLVQIPFPPAKGPRNQNGGSLPARLPPTPYLAREWHKSGMPTRHRGGRALGFEDTISRSLVIRAVLRRQRKSSLHSARDDRLHFVLNILVGHSRLRRDPNWRARDPRRAHLDGGN